MSRCAFGMAVVAAALMCAPAPAAKKQAAKLPDVAFILNTGSTNTSGYQVEVLASGNCGINASPNQSLLPGLEKRPVPTKRSSLVATFTLVEGNVPLALARQFFRDIKAAQPLAQLPVRMTAKSVSFGTSTYVEYGGQRTPDLSSPADARGQALAADVKAITAALGVRNLPRRPVGPMTPLVPGH